MKRKQGKVIFNTFYRALIFDINKKNDLQTGQLKL